VSVTITYTVACGKCGGEATSTTLDLTNPQPDGSLRIDLEMTAAQEEFECSNCGATVYTGDLDVMTEDEDDEDEDDGGS
jgi:ribosomal protein S27AE